MAPPRMSKGIQVMVAVAEAQQRECVPQLNRLLACRAYLAAPGAAAAAPSAECCGALAGISRECACSTMAIINSIPSRCGVSQVNCTASSTST
ncbi:non-specific lipid-transfer protein C4 [Brachypodium distachyon]|uniref:Bifunctional inhibitor/plant lipid transfer protein/seed storage helical domain-containing protein n=1 Tax=Brachypodium distachyon TaxID=15368 RepID=I1I975_BRADI|nr:non-specific lipid-transfer protein C4 [Brachypodium distachyon]KQJ99259.1 hypothetical protein BRADI_3g42070v3 [Brachypodium distachyon]|eukprot:XP_014756460.1 non-specific lipid-transfer protein C4 [Brachypodium distachyon]